MISGSWPGEIFFFAGAKDVAFEESVKLDDESGKPVNVGQASAVALHDWDGDGDLDLLIGVIEGDVKFVPNLGGKGTPRFGAAQAVSAAGNNIKMTGDAGPTVADWDGDGVDDLICGDGNGSVWFYRATGRGDKGLPTLAAGVELIPALSSEQRMAAYQNPVDDPKGELVTRPGDRSKPFVTDWNGDGRPDLLVGDFQMTSSAAPKLTQDDIAERDRLQKQQGEVMKTYSTLWKQLDAKLRERIGVEVEAPMNDEQQERWGALYDEVSKEVDGFEEVAGQVQDLWTQLARFEPQRNYHGWVWVYLQKPGASAAAESVEVLASRITLDAPTTRRPFSAGMTVVRGTPEDIVTVIVRGRLAPGWHVYAHVPADEPYIQTELKLQLPPGAEAVGEWSRPEGVIDPHAPTLRLWMGDLVFSHQVRLPKTAAGSAAIRIGCTISYQCCDENSCLPPDEIELSSSVELSALELPLYELATERDWRLPDGLRDLRLLDLIGLEQPWRCAFASDYSDYQADFAAYVTPPKR